jgi:tRNA modification GTPase
MHHAPFRHPATGEILDRLNFVFMPGPGSPTGEDVLEIYPHGNMLLVERILEAVLALEPGETGTHRLAPGAPLGALPNSKPHPLPEAARGSSPPGTGGPVRLAGPGEFTRRALENGRIDLLQAEAVGELIHAQTLEALRNAQRLVAGELAAPLKTLRDDLLDLSVRLELDVDFAEEEADPDFASWALRLEGIRRALLRLERGFERSRSLARAPRVVLLGAPNAGKSSLVNALIEEERLLVSSIPGTTRDYVEVPLRLPGGMVHLVDTAGLGRPVDGLDEMAMERTRAQGSKADLLVWVVDGTAPDGEVPPEVAAVLGREGGAGRRRVGPGVGRGSVEAEPGTSGTGEMGNLRDTVLRVRTRRDLPGFRSADGALAVSNRSREGIAELIRLLDARLFRERDGEEDVRLATERQFQAVRAARERVDAACDHLKESPAVEILAFEVREAAGCLRDLLGEISPDEVLQKVFAGFCIGK